MSPAYVEERELVVRLQFRRGFPDDYEGEDDGYEWARVLPEIGAEVVRAAVAALQARPGWKVRGGNRGRPTDEELTLIVEKDA
jgi:hypothetical protein